LTAHESYSRIITIPTKPGFECNFYLVVSRPCSTNFRSHHLNLQVIQPQSHLSLSPIIPSPPSIPGEPFCLNLHNMFEFVSTEVRTCMYSFYTFMRQSTDSSLYNSRFVFPHPIFPKIMLRHFLYDTIMESVPFEENEWGKLPYNYGSGVSGADFRGEARK
jgi:hypothetical protein